MTKRKPYFTHPLARAFVRASQFLNMRYRDQLNEDDLVKRQRFIISAQNVRERDVEFDIPHNPPRLRNRSPKQDPTT